MILSRNKYIPCLFWFLIILTQGIQSTRSSPTDTSRSSEENPTPTIKLLIEGLGNGYSTPAVTEKLIYITGEKDSLGYITAFDWDGNEKWKNCYGPEWTISFRGSRAEPVVDDTRVYVCSGLGSLTCFHAITGEKIWNIHFINDLGGKNVTYGYSMPVLIEGDQIFCSPGGVQNNIVALDKNSGRISWSSTGVGETAGYGKPLLVDRGGLKILMTFSEMTFLGINALTGDVLWTFDLNFDGELPCNQPIYHAGNIYIVAGPGNGTIAFHLSADGKSIEERWRNPDLNSAFGGFVLEENYLVGSADYKRTYVLVDTEKGNTKSQVRFGNGAIIREKNRLITYNQKGQLGIMKITNGKLRLDQGFRVYQGSGEHFAIPVYYKNMLLVRHGNALIGYQLFLEESPY